MYRLLAIDLDGTLLDSKGQVPPPTAEALQRAHAAGLVLAPATARWYQAAIRPFTVLGIQPAAIASAGADVRTAGGEKVARHRLPPEFASFVADLCDRAGWPATFAVPERAYRRANELPPWAANAPEWLQPVTSLAEISFANLLAVLAEPAPGDPFLHELEAWSDRVSLHNAISFTGDGMVTVTAKGIDKGTALLSLASRSLSTPPKPSPSAIARSTSLCSALPASPSQSKPAPKPPAPPPTASSPAPTKTA